MFSEVALAHGQEANGRELAIDLPYTDSSTGEELTDTYIFTLELSDHGVAARARGIPPVLIDDMRKVTDTAKTPALHMADLRTMEDMLDKGVHESLAGIRARQTNAARTTKVLAFDLDALPDGSFESKWTAFADEFTKARKTYGRDGVIELIGDPVRVARALKNQTALASVSAGVMFDSLQIPADLTQSLKDGSAIRVRMAGVARGAAKPVLRPGERLMPMRRLTDKDIPAVRALFELGLAIGDADLTSSQDINDLASAWRTMSGHDIASDVLRSIVQNAADLETILLHALAPLAPVDIDLAVRYLKYRPNVDRSA
jgi:hypothetical protein